MQTYFAFSACLTQKQSEQNKHIPTIRTAKLNRTTRMLVPTLSPNLRFFDRETVQETLVSLMAVHLARTKALDDWTFSSLLGTKASPPP